MKSSAMFLIGAALLAAHSVRADEQAVKPIFDLRLRSENVDQQGLADDAHATTLRVHAGFETAKKWNTSFLVEGEGIVPLQDDYRPDPAVATKMRYPVVPDAETYELNRAQITNTSLPGTTLTLGRQRILIDDQRFVGNVGWRQNEQTFDALRVVNKSVANLVIDATYFNRVNRVFGPDSPQGHFEGNSGLLNVSYQTKAGRITGFGYLLDFENIATIPAAVRDSTSTYGLRFAGERPVGKVKVAYVASYAQQTDFADNPLSFDLDYEFVEGTVSFRQFTLGAGAEIMEGNGVKGFTTPLATLHKFQGWADKFLATPPNGIEDVYATAGVTWKAVAGLDTLGLVVNWHDYEAERIDASYGHETDVSLAAKVKKVSLMLKFADFEGDALASARDTQKWWAQVEFAW